MATYLLTWNPKHWPWDNLTECVNEVAERGSHIERWSCGRTKRIAKGDRVFLLRQGVEPRGIVGAGTVVVSAYEDAHWDETPGKRAQYVQVSFDALQDPETDSILPRARLDELPFAAVNWNTQSSGISIPEPVAEAIEREWHEVLEGRIDNGGRVGELEILYEGAPRAVSLNIYERNREARRQCIAKYGTSCIVCGFDFGATYGSVADGYIHVHHLRPVSELGERYEVDPVRDLRPVCPNCHAVIHRRSPPFLIEEVQVIMRKRAE